jgi:hypothetical protein
VSWYFNLKVESGGGDILLKIEYPARTRIRGYALLRRVKPGNGILVLLEWRYRRYAPLKHKGQLGIYLTMPTGSF